MVSRQADQLPELQAFGPPPTKLMEEAPCLRARFGTLKRFGYGVVDLAYGRPVAGSPTDRRSISRFDVPCFGHQSTRLVQ